MNLEKILQSQGFGSRKQCRYLIESGQVMIAEQPCTDPKAEIAPKELQFKVANQQWQYHEKLYIALNKPIGFECSHHPQHHRGVFELLPTQFIQRGIQSVGRLDQDTTGLLLLTDDGNFLQALTHPKKHVPKCYQLSTAREITPQQVEQLINGVELHNEAGLFAADQCVQLDSHQLILTIHQGIYHQVKRMLAAVGNHVVQLHRQQIGCLSLPSNLNEGEWIYLTDMQIQQARGSIKN